MERTDEISRRDFVKVTAAGTAAVAGSTTGLHALDTVAGAGGLPQRIVAALGPVFVPSRPGDPGYKELEQYGISQYVMQQDADSDSGDFRFGVAGGGNGWLKPESLEAFNAGSQPLFGGKSFVDLDEKQREEYVGMIVDGSKITDATQREKLQAFFRDARRRIMRVYYGNYPEHQVKRDAQGVPILKPGDTHQYTNPNTDKIVTGWDIVGYKGLADWEEEERRRDRAKKTLPYWYEAPVVSLNPARPPAARATKSADGHDYYDVVVLGGGTAGCIVAGRLAERGVNPKTGDRLRVVMIEGGDDWTIRDPAIRPGYGQPIRRRMITKISDGIGPDGGGGKNYTWPEVGYDENFKILGGCSMHFGGTCWLPADEDFQFYRQTSGVNWDLAKFGDAIQEVRDLYHVMNPPDSWWTKGDHIFAEGARALGFEVRTPEIAYRNPIGDDGDVSRYDAKGTSLPWAYFGMNNGLKIIANADIQKIVIEKPAGGRPVATGAVYKDKAGVVHEVRAARVISALGTGFTPGLLYRSGYGPREFLGDQTIVENKNVGHHLTADVDLISTAYMAEPMVEERGNGARGADPWAATTPRPWADLTWQVRGGASAGEGNPAGSSVGIYAPPFGWEHKEYMRNNAGPNRMMTWRNHVGAIPAEWRVKPDRQLEQYSADTARIDASIKEMEQIVRQWQAKLSVKVVKADFRSFRLNAKTMAPFHRTGTARAGENRENSVCTSDFDCHDIENLLFTSGASIPKTFFWSCGPIAVAACYAWRRMIANHFSKGSSTKGFA